MKQSPRDRISMHEKQLIDHMRQRLLKVTHSFVAGRDKFIRSHHILYTFIAGVGLITFWYGIWEGLRMIPFLGHPVVSILVGGLIVFVCGAYASQFIGVRANEFRKGITDVAEDIEDISEDLEIMVQDVEDVTERVDEMAVHIENLDAKNETKSQKRRNQAKE